MTLTSDKCALIILDGWGIGDDDSSNAIAAAHTPFMDELLRQHPKATLRTDGEHVGLPDGQMGNSEVGHMNIGAGRIVYQDICTIDNAIEADELPGLEDLRQHIAKLKASGGVCHVMGCVHALVLGRRPPPLAPLGGCARTRRY